MFRKSNAPSQSEPGPTSAAQASRSDASLCPFQPGDASQASGGNTLSFFSSTNNQADDPNIGFGDLGRKLGEMWHALDENEKEDYRRRAR